MAGYHCLRCRSALQKATQMRQSLPTCRRNAFSITPISAGGVPKPTSTRAKQRHGSRLPGQQIDIEALLRTPTWSVRSLLPPSGAASDGTTTTTPSVTPAQLHHLLRLSALPQPKSTEEEEGMLRTLASQLHFVRDIQSVDTTGIEPLVTIRDETDQGLREATIGLKDPGIAEALQAEKKVGRMGRVRRAQGLGRAAGWKALHDVPDRRSLNERLWRPLEGAEGRTEGNYFVVESGKKGMGGEGGAGDADADAGDVVTQPG